MLSYHAVERIGERLCKPRRVADKFGRWIPPSMIQEILDDVMVSVNTKWAHIYLDEGKWIVTQGKLAYYALSPWGDVITVMSFLTKEYKNHLKIVKRSFARTYFTQSEYMDSWKLEQVGRRR